MRIREYVIEAPAAPLPWLPKEVAKRIDKGLLKKLKEGKEVYEKGEALVTSFNHASCTKAYKEAVAKARAERNLDLVPNRAGMEDAYREKKRIARGMLKDDLAPYAEHVAKAMDLAIEVAQEHLDAILATEKKTAEDYGIEFVPSYGAQSVASRIKRLRAGSGAARLSAGYGPHHILQGILDL